MVKSKEKLFHPPSDGDDSILLQVSSQISSAPSSPQKKASRPSGLRTTPTKSLSLVTSVYEKKIEKLENEKRLLQHQLSSEQENSSKSILDMINRKASELKLDDQQGQTLMDLVSSKTTIARLKKEMAIRDEQLASMEKERLEIEQRLDEWMRRSENQQHQIDKLTEEQQHNQLSKKDQDENMQEIDNQNLELRNKNITLENEREMLRKTIHEQEIQSKKLMEKTETLDTQLRQMLAFQRQNQQLNSENQRLTSLVQNFESQLGLKTQENDEMNRMQEELLRVIAEEKKKVQDLTKNSSGDTLQREKIFKENERLELLVDKLTADYKKNQKEFMEQKHQITTQFEEKESMLLSENISLKRELQHFKEKLGEEQFNHQQTISNYQNKINQLTEQLREQVEMYKRTVGDHTEEASKLKQKQTQQLTKVKKEMQSSYEIISILREANKKMEENFLSQQKIINSMELELDKVNAQNKDLKDQVDILKFKLPKMFKLGNSQTISSTTIADRSITISNSTCSKSTQFFDSSSMYCKDCSSHEVSTDGLYCYCDEGYKQTFTTSAKTCELCTFASSRDRSICMTCGISTLGFDANISDCKCNGTSKLVEKDIAGNYFSAKQCVSCGPKSIPHPSNRYLCVSCPDPIMQSSFDGSSCICPATHQLWSNMCILKEAYQDINSKYPIDSSALITFIQVFENSRKDTPSTESVRSKLFYEYFYQAGAHCKSLQNVTSCQMLANLCTLLLYDESTPACKMYFSIFNTLTEDRLHGFSGWKNGLPWLKYTGTSSENLYSTDLIQSVGLSGRTDRVTRLQFYLSKFNVYGNWLGFEELTNQLELCPTSNFQGSGFLDFGNNYFRSCFYNVLSLPYTQQPYFYELYLMDSGVLYPVPVQILKDDKSSFSDIGTSTLYRRFFLYDNIAGITTDSTIPSIVRILESAQLYVSLNPSLSEKIYPPTLTLKYTSRKIQGLTLSKFTNFDSESITAPSISFSASYIQSQQTQWIVILVFAIIGLIGSILTSCVSSYRYSRRRLSQIDFPTLGKFVFTFCAHFSNYLFILIAFIVSLYYLFFKLQDSVFVLLPNFDGADKWYFFIIVLIALLGKAIDLGYEFYKHCSYDIFFMDWEKSKGKVVGVGGRAEGSYSSVSIWRSYFIAKEWEKLQELTWTSLEFTLILVLLILDGGDVIHLASMSPLENTILTNYPSHPILRLALLMWFYLSISLVQYLFFKFILYRFTRNPITSLIDTCSIANISILILDELHCGCYIHGESIFRFADSNMKEFYEGLSLESNDFFPKRGLLQTSSEQKRNVVLTFDLFISRSVRENYDNFLLIPIQEEEAKNGFLRRAIGNQRTINQRPAIPQANTTNNQFPPPSQNSDNQQSINPASNNLPLDQPIQQTMRERNQINNPLLNSPLQGDFRISDIFNFNVGQKSRYIPAAFIDGYNTINEYFKRVVTDVKIKQGQILDKQLSYRLGFVPDFVYQHDREFFFKDDYGHFFQNYSFFRVMLRGAEWKMIFFNILLFAIMNIFWDSIFGILMIVYVVNRGFLMLRRNFVRNNLISKTLLDRRFLF